MGQWIILVIGVLLTANGFYTRTYDFPNETPVRYCFNMDYISVYGCFHNSTAPNFLAWGPFLFGIVLVVCAIAYSLRRPKA